jgi:eukaryotic-like serine/threonine-protein kinase
MADPVLEKMWIQYLQANGLATFEDIEAALKAMQSPHDTLPDILVRHNILTQVQRENIQKKLAQEQHGLTQLGSFRLTKKIGEGGMGAVYLAEDSMAGRTVAIKVLPQRFSGNPEFIARFRREARATGKLNHPNIVAAYSFGEEAGNHFYVMEYMSGRPLDSHLKEGSRLPWSDAVKIVIQVAEGLRYAHDHNLIHRDIKPANVFLTDDGVAKILDLGLSKSIEEAEQSFLTQSGTVLGTPHYISPEQARGEKNIDGRTDIYSLGATFYHLVTGRTPFDGSGAAVIMTKHLTEQLPNPLDFNPDLPESVAQVICKMMAKHPDDRYSACADLITDLSLLQSGKQPSGAHLEEGRSSVAMHPVRPAVSDIAKRMIHTKPPSQAEVPTRVLPPEKEKKSSHRLPIPALIIAGSLAAMIGFGILATRSTTTERKPEPEPVVVKEEPKKSPEPKAETKQPVEKPPEKQTVVVNNTPVRGRETVDLLKLIDLNRDTVRGTWQNSAEGLLSDWTGDFAQDVGGARVEFPYRPPGEYDFRVTFTKQQGQNCIGLLFPAPPGALGARGTYALVVGGWGNSLAGFEMVNTQGLHGPQNTTARRGNWLRTNQRQTLVLHVRRNGARATLDGQEITFTRPNYENMQPPHWYALKNPNVVGISSWSTPILFHSVEIVELSNGGEILREGPK